MTSASDEHKQNNVQGVPATIAIGSGNCEDDKIKIENFTAKNGEISCKIKKDVSSFILMHSAYNPQREAEQMIENLDFSKPSAIIVFGLGMGYHIEEILKRMSANSRLIIIEPSQKVYDNFLKMRNPDFIYNDSRVILLVNINTCNTSMILSYMSEKFLFYWAFNLQYICLNYYTELGGDVLDFFKRIADILSFQWKTLGNCQVDHNIGVVQTILNVQQVIDNVGLNDVKDFFKGQAAMLISAGPSLDKNLKYIKKAKSKIFIIAVDAVLDKLLKNNIIPDMLVTVERLEVYRNIFKNIKMEIPDEIILAAPPVIELNTMNFFKKNNKVVVFQKGVGTQVYFNEGLNKGIMPTGTSAAYAGLHLATDMGFEKIILVGQDLSYGKDGQIYCDDISKEGNEEERKRMENSFYIEKVKNYDEEEVLTNIFWKDQLVSFEALIKGTPEFKVYNAADKGAKIEGAPKTDLSEYIRDNSDKVLPNLNEHIKKIKERISEKQKKEVLKSLLTKMQGDLIEFREIEEDIKKQSNKLEKMYKSYMIVKKPIIQHDKEMIKNFEVLNLSQKLIDSLAQNTFLVLYYQGLIAAFKKEINQIPDSDFETKFLKHVDIQHDYIELIRDIFKLNLAFFNWGIEYLELQIKGKKTENDVVKIFKDILDANNTDSEFIYEYLRTTKEEWEA